MNEPQIQSLLTAIAISSGLSPNITPSQRTAAFESLEQFKSYPGRIAGCVELIGRQSLLIDGVDVTAPTKLFSLGLIQEFLKVGYASLEEGDRVQLRTSILMSARQLAMTDTSAMDSSGEATLRTVSMKIASLLADIAVREFPQRWNGFVTDLFTGIWGEGNSTVGVKICLECLKLMTEDCTDSDFNSKVSSCTF
jgi:hypothetical protein